MAALKPTELLDLLSSSQMNPGRAKNRLHHYSKPGNYLPAAQRKLLQAVADSKRVRNASRVSHPDDESRRQQYRRDKDEDLSPVELAWLQRLPLDPAAVTFDDAAQLAALANSVSQTKTPASYRLVESVWRPVKQLHDERVAKARVEHAREPLTELPDVTLDAIVDALEEEYPGVSRDALRYDAQQIVVDFTDQRDRANERAIERADQHLADVAADISRTNETAREAVA
jgi:hypothetical protein